jgi:hypothetical protein
VHNKLKQNFVRNIVKKRSSSHSNVRGRSRTQFGALCALSQSENEFVGVNPRFYQNSGLNGNSVAWSTSELYRPRDCRLSAKLVPTFEDGGCCVVSATDPYGRILGFLARSRYVFFQVAPQLYSRGWVDPVPDPLLLRKSGSARPGRTRTSGSVAKNSTTRPQRESLGSLYFIIISISFTLVAFLDLAVTWSNPLGVCYSSAPSIRLVMQVYTFSVMICDTIILLASPQLQPTNKAEIRGLYCALNIARSLNTMTTRLSTGFNIRTLG